MKDPEAELCTSLFAPLASGDTDWSSSCNSLAGCRSWVAQRWERAPAVLRGNNHPAARSPVFSLDRSSGSWLWTQPVLVPLQADSASQPQETWRSSLHTVSMSFPPHKVYFWNTGHGNSSLCLPACRMHALYALFLLCYVCFASHTFVWYAVQKVQNIICLTLKVMWGILGIIIPEKLVWSPGIHTRALKFFSQGTGNEFLTPLFSDGLLLARTKMELGSKLFLAEWI